MSKIKYQELSKSATISLCLLAAVTTTSLQAFSPLEDDEMAHYSATISGLQYQEDRDVSQQQKIHKPFIITREDGSLKVGNFLKKIQPTLLKFNDLSYSLVKGGGTHLKSAVEDHEFLTQAGWSYRSFYGFEGKNREHADLPGLVAYHPQKALMTIVYHGTATIDDGVMAGWDTNFDATPIDGSEYNLPNFSGKVHQGFAKKYSSTRQQMIGLIQEYRSKMSDEEKKNFRIVITGHSQGASLGNLALYDIARNYGQDLFGEDFNNSLNSRLYGYFLSVPRVGDEDYIKALHTLVGNENLIRQNVHGDPVPVVLGNIHYERTLRFLSPIIKPAVGLKAFSLKGSSIYKDSGYLLLDTTSSARKRMKDKGLDQDVWKNHKKVMEDFAIGQVSSIQHSLDLGRFKQEVIEETSQSRGFWKVPGFLGALIKGTALRIVKPFLPAPKAALGLLSNSLVSKFAHLHYGHDNADQRGAVFCSEIVGAGDELNVMFGRGLRKENK
ncbi:MAG: lipase family protein [Alphaproteobacteria bacterium]|nr:lipase family protein [Alphaproteobacteria bacterium]